VAGRRSDPLAAALPLALQRIRDVERQTGAGLRDLGFVFGPRVRFAPVAAVTKCILAYRSDRDARQAPPFRAGKDSARLAQRAVSDDAATGKLSRKRTTPGQGKVTPAEIRAAKRGTRPRNPAVPAAQAAQSESPGLQAGEDVK